MSPAPMAPAPKPPGIEEACERVEAVADMIEGLAGPPPNGAAQPRGPIAAPNGAD